MSLPDPTAIAALQADVVKPVHFAFVDILGDPIRVNTSGADITPTGTGDVDLDGLVFTGIGGSLVSFSDVKFAPGGSGPVTAEISGIPGLDDETLEQLADRANWQGRRVRRWKLVRNSANIAQGGLHNFYNGRIVALSHSGTVDGQTIKIAVESYIVFRGQASNRSYMTQSQFDAGDNSAAAAKAIANGNYTGASAGSSFSYTGGNLLARTALRNQ